MPMDPNALPNLWSHEEFPACDEGMEPARAFLTSAARPSAILKTTIHGYCLRELVVLFRILAAHNVTCPKCNQVSTADSIVAMPA